MRDYFINVAPSLAKSARLPRPAMAAQNLKFVLLLKAEQLM